MTVDVSGDSDYHVVDLKVNGVNKRAVVEARLLLVDMLRENFGLTGTNVGCGQGDCGACTILIDGVATRSCITLAVQADGSDVTTIEGLATADIDPVQQVFLDAQAQQCGFCTPGMLMQSVEIVNNYPNATRDDIRDLIAGNLCRCTGYQHIVDAIEQALIASSEDNQ